MMSRILAILCIPIHLPLLQNENYCIRFFSLILNMLITIRIFSNRAITRCFHFLTFFTFLNISIMSSKHERDVWKWSEG